MGIMTDLIEDAEAYISNSKPLNDALTPTSAKNVSTSRAVITALINLLLPFLGALRDVLQSLWGTRGEDMRNQLGSNTVKALRLPAVGGFWGATIGSVFAAVALFAPHGVVAVLKAAGYSTAAWGSISFFIFMGAALLGRVVLTVLATGKARKILADEASLRAESVASSGQKINIKPETAWRTAFLGSDFNKFRAARETNKKPAIELGSTSTKNATSKRSSTSKRAATAADPELSKSVSAESLSSVDPEHSGSQSSDASHHVADDRDIVSVLQQGDHHLDPPPTTGPSVDTAPKGAATTAQTAKLEGKLPNSLEEHPLFQAQQKKHNPKAPGDEGEGKAQPHIK